MKTLKTLHDEKLVNGLSFNDSENMNFCKGCVKGKQKRNAFTRNEATRSFELLVIVHSDVCGPMQTVSLFGNRHFVTFIDDKSRFAIDVVDGNHSFFMSNRTRVTTKRDHIFDYLTTIP